MEVKLPGDEFWCEVLGTAVESQQFKSRVKVGQIRNESVEIYVGIGDDLFWEGVFSRISATGDNTEALRIITQDIERIMRNCVARLWLKLEEVTIYSSWGEEPFAYQRLPIGEVLEIPRKFEYKGKEYWTAVVGLKFRCSDKEV